MRICGIDPGLSVTGYAVIEGSGTNWSVLDAGTIKPDKGKHLGRRLHRIYVDLCELLDEYDPEIMAIENVYSHYAHPQTAVLMGHARGVLILAASQREISIRDLAATQIKRSLTGNGRASKAQMQHAIQMNLGLAEVPEPHDVADALAMALCVTVQGRLDSQAQGFSAGSGVSRT